MTTLPETLPEAFRSTGNIVLTTHINPDGDALGSLIGLADILAAMGKQVFRYLEEPVSHLYAFLPDTDLLRTDMDELRNFVRRAGEDVLCVSLDCGDRQRLGRHGDEFLRIRPFIVIDHHKGNDGFGDLTWIDPYRSSTGEMIFDLAMALEQNLSARAATALYAAMVTDTGSFRYESTNAHTFDVARQLVNFGARPHEVAQNLFDNYTVNRLRLLQKVLASLEVHCRGRVAMISVTGDMLAATGCTMEDTENFINLPRSVMTVEVAVFLKEIGEGRVSVSLRAKDTCDVAEVAARFGGGGHRNAAGFRAAEVTVAEVRSRLLEELNRRLGC
ncbi:MAG: bifunctional oligoribonuclease/PAP phosphatase NrnA [Desulfobulbaceae bacterium]|jgi:phosphoesterase RecJ-like protein|nr:bifunctional oligoribonuclease/PAP phosphatase NrnA [Desulfobulbaceae bacterium]MDY0350098.1 bifunctional oligoribonuclease/PAP phosphatase NrnA [Desulfobulbaceae bacterium]